MVIFYLSIFFIHTYNKIVHLGFTPWPYDVSYDALEYVYNKIKVEGTIISHHIDGSLPWNESYYDLVFPKHLRDDWDYRKQSTDSSVKIFLSVTPLDISRSNLALNWEDDGDGKPLKFPFVSAKFNSELIKTSYLNYVKRSVEFFNPDYLCIAIEQNLLLSSDEVKYEEFFELYQYVYNEIKIIHPKLPVFPSNVFDKFFEESEKVKQKEKLKRILQYSDFFGLSIHPQVSMFLCDQLPDLTNIFDLNENLPIVITETSYPSKPFNAYTFFFNCTEDEQYEYFSYLFNLIKKYDIEFLINFVVRDYDLLYDKLFPGDQLAKLWRHTGLYDKNGDEKLLVKLWHDELIKQQSNNDVKVWIIIVGIVSCGLLIIIMIVLVIFGLVFYTKKKKNNYKEINFQSKQ